MACCYAVQDKVWVDGPDGEPWEIYTVLADVEMAPGELRTVAARRRRACAARRRPSPPPAAADRARWIATSRAAPRPRSSAPRSSSPIVVGSGISAQRLSPDDVGLQLLENSIATGAGLVALILAFGPVSGAHFNPVVTLADRVLGGIDDRATRVVYVVAQIVGACVGAMVANLMFDLARGRRSRPTPARRARSGSARSSPPSGCCS